MFSDHLYGSCGSVTVGWWIVAVVEFSEPVRAGDDALALLRTAIDQVQAVVVSCLDLDELESLTTGLLRQAERLAAATSEAVAECDRSGLARRRGSFGSTTS